MGLAGLVLALGLVGLASGEPPKTYAGRICAFVDANFDQVTDLVVANATHLRILIGNTKNDIAGSFETGLNQASETFESDESSYGVLLPKGVAGRDVANCAVAAINDDHYPDLLITTKDSVAHLCLGRPKDENNKATLMLNCSAKWELAEGHQPSLLDYDGDGRADVFLPADKDKRRRCLHFPKGEQTKAEELGCFNTSSTPTEASFVHSLLAHSRGTTLVFAIGVRNDSDKHTQVELWEQDDGGQWSLRPRLWQPYNVEASKLLDSSASAARGYELVADLTGSGSSHLVLSQCADEQCTSLLLYLSPDLNDLEKPFTRMEVPLADSSIVKSGGRIRLRAGDYDQDGFTDLLLLTQKDGAASTSVVQSTACSASEGDCQSSGPMAGRKFELRMEKLVEDPSVLSMGPLKDALFFDLGEDGKLDLVLMGENKDGKEHFTFVSDVHKEATDVSFLKVQIQAAVCKGEDGCPGSDGTSGMAVPGAVVSFVMANELGSDTTAVAVQVAQTSHGALHLPFLLFGLGQTPGYIDKIHMRSWTEQGGLGVRTKEVAQVVPNSRLYAVPPSSSAAEVWVVRLFLTPSRLLILAGIGLVSVCAFCLLVVLALHCKERQEDLAQQKAERQRFHFDAL